MSFACLRDSVLHIEWGKVYKRNTAEKILMGMTSNPFVSKRFGGLGARRDGMKSVVRRVKWFSPCLTPLKLQRREHPVPWWGEVQGRVGGTRGLQPGVGEGLAVSAWLLPKVVGCFIQSLFAGGCFVLIWALSLHTHEEAWTVCCFTGSFPGEDKGILQWGFFPQIVLEMCWC